MECRRPSERGERRFTQSRFTVERAKIYSDDSKEEIARSHPHENECGWREAIGGRHTVKWLQRYKGRTRKGLAVALPGSGPKLVEDASALVLQETLTRFGLNTHHQRDLLRGPPSAAQVSYM
jgi:hypothetical protein